MGWQFIHSGVDPWTHPPGTTNGQAIVFKICVNYKDRGLYNQKYYQHNSKCNEMNMASLGDSNQNMIRTDSAITNNTLNCFLLKFPSMPNPLCKFLPFFQNSLC